jgi:hypothetical protein
MEIKKTLDGLLQKDMDRKEFLAHVGVAGLAVFGVSNVIKSLTEGSGPRDKRSGGYGGSAYGGDRKLGKVNRRIG